MDDLPADQDVVHLGTRQQWLDRAAFALYQAQRTEFPEAFPLPWDQAPPSVRADRRYLIMTAYRRTLPLVPETLTEIVAMNYANLDGWVWPGCDNKSALSVPDNERAAHAAQRRQGFRHKARQLLSSIFNYLEHDTDTEAQRRITVDRAEHQRNADAMVVSFYRNQRGILEVNRG
jgi:hypothetical protein